MIGHFNMTEWPLKELQAWARSRWLHFLTKPAGHLIQAPNGKTCSTHASSLTADRVPGLHSKFISVYETAAEK